MVRYELDQWQGTNQTKGKVRKRPMAKYDSDRWQGTNQNRGMVRISVRASLSKPSYGYGLGRDEVPS